MATNNAESFYCEKCKRTLKGINFYTYKDGRKTEMCKNCLTMHIDNFNPDTYVWILQKMDVPYVPSEWNVLRDRAYAKDPYKMNGTTVIGKYLSKMKLNQWKDKTWADTEALQAEALAKEAISKEEQAEVQNMVQEQYSKGEISEAEYRTMMDIATLNENAVSATGVPLPPLPQSIAQGPDFYNEDKFMAIEDMPDLAAELTQEDKIFLAMKWGRLYEPAEWIALEQKYKEMSESFDVNDSDTISTVKLICKTDLKMNQALDQGDIDGFQKLSRVSESLRKSGKFTAAQNKENKQNFLDSIGELVVLCEREEGFIPRFCTDIPQDKVDLTLQDMNNYVKKLVTEDLGFGQQIETALKKIQLQNEFNKEASAKEAEEEAENSELRDSDYQEFYDVVASWQQQDEELLEGEDDY